MKIKTLWIFPLVIILIISINCSKDKSHDENRGTTEMQSEPERPQQLQIPFRKGNMQGVSGLGRGLGRRMRRTWQPNDVIHLSSEEEEAIEIQTATVVSRPVRGHLDSMGKVLEHQYRKAIISYAFSARISESHAKLGDWVKKGQKLITLQSEEVGTAKSEFYKAIADHELALVNHERIQRLFDRGVGAKKDLLATEAELKVAETNMNAAEKKLHVLGFSEEHVQAIDETHQINPVITLYAPITGKIIEDNAVLGAMIDQASEILVLLDPRILYIDAEIYEKDIAMIKLDQDVEAQVPAYPEKIFKGKISYIGDVLKENTRTITVRSEVENPQLKLKPGMFADMKVFLNQQTHSLVIPKSAVLDDGDNKIVFIKMDDHFVPTIVEVGNQSNGHVEIISGLQEGDIVVTQGSFQIMSKLFDNILEKGQVH